MLIEIYFPLSRELWWDLEAQVSVVTELIAATIIRKRTQRSILIWIAPASSDKTATDVL